MILLLEIVVGLVVSFVGLVFVAAVVSVVLDHRKLDRARRAALTARERLDLERKLADQRERVDVRVVVLPLGTNSYRWIAWDDAPMFPEQVEGVLVPYSAGMSESLEQAQADARVAVFRRLEGRGRVTRFELEPPEPGSTATRGGAS